MYLKTTHGVSNTMSQVPPKPQLSGPSDHSCMVYEWSKNLLSHLWLRGNKQKKNTKSKIKQSLSLALGKLILHLAISLGQTKLIKQYSLKAYLH